MKNVVKWSELNAKEYFDTVLQRPYLKDMPECRKELERIIFIARFECGDSKKIDTFKKLVRLSRYAQQLEDAEYEYVCG